MKGLYVVLQNKKNFKTIKTKNSNSHKTIQTNKRIGKK